MSENGNPHSIGKVLVGEDEYQAPPRDEDTFDEEPGDGDILEHLDDGAAEKPMDINLLEAQQQPGIAAPIPVAPSDKKNLAVSGPDEMTQPGCPKAPPP